MTARATIIASVGATAVGLVALRRTARRSTTPMLERIPDADLVRIPDVGHVPMPDDPAAIAKPIMEVTRIADIDDSDTIIETRNDGR